MKLEELNEKSKRVSIYFDYTGAGRRPKMIAGPFKTFKDAQKYAKENDWDLKGNSNYFIDDYRGKMDK